MSFEYPVAGEPPIKIGGEWRPPGKGPHDDLEVRVAYALRHGDKLAEFLAGLELTQMTLFKQEDGWLVMLKGKRPGAKRVAFMQARTFADGLVWAATALDTNRVPWRVDKPRPAG